MDRHEHYCENIDVFPSSKFLQLGSGKGKKVLIVGEAPAPNGWRKSGKAFYTIDSKLLPTGKNLNKLLESHSLTVETCSFTELVKCYVGKDRKLLKSCGEKCWPIFLKQLKSYDFEVLILLGVKTLELFNNFLNSSIPLGVIFEVNIENRNYKILPLYHPSPISPVGHRNNLKIFKNNKNLLQSVLN